MRVCGTIRVCFKNEYKLKYKIGKKRVISERTEVRCANWTLSNATVVGHFYPGVITAWTITY